jgi:hypothetical protein
MTMMKMKNANVVDEFVAVDLDLLSRVSGGTQLGFNYDDKQDHLDQAVQACEERYTDDTTWLSRRFDSDDRKTHTENLQKAAQCKLDFLKPLLLPKQAQTQQTSQQ